MADENTPVEALEEDRDGNPLSLPVQPERNGDEPRFRWTIKRRRFCHNFVASNGVVGKSALDAGYQNAEEGGYLLTLTPIRAAIQKDLRAHLLANEVTEQSVIARWQNWAECSPADYFEMRDIGPAIFNEEGLEVGREVVGRQMVLKDLDELTDVQRKSLKKITVKDTRDGQDITIEVQDQARANEKLAQVLGLLNTDAQHSNIPPPEDAARLIHDFLVLAEEADNGTGLQQDTDAGEEGSEPERKVASA